MKTTKIHNFIYLIMVLYAVFFNIERFVYYGVVIYTALLLFLLLSESKNGKLVVDSISRSLIISLLYISIVSSMVLLLGFSSLAGINSLIKEVARIIIYIVTIQCINKISLSSKFYIRLWRLLILIMVAVSLIQFTKIYDVNSILKQFYGDSVQFYNTEKDSFSSFRSGSIFVNPNVFATFLCSFLACYLSFLSLQNEKITRKIVTFLIIGLGLLLCGSRTGIVLATVIIVFFFIKNRKSKSYSKPIIILVLILSLSVVAFASFGKIDFSDIRAFQISQGFGSSMSTKWDIWSNLLKEMNGVNLIFGYAPFNYGSGSLLVDFELGYFTMFYGVFGLVLYFILCNGIFKYKNNSGECGLPRINSFFLILFLIFGFSSGVYLNLRLFVLCEVLFCVSFKNVIFQ